MADIYVQRGEETLRFRVIRDLGFDPRSKLYHKAVLPYEAHQGIGLGMYAAYARTRRGPWKIIGVSVSDVEAPVR